MDLIYIGEEFYTKSNSMMSSIYDIQGNRQDWGKVQVALRRGEHIHIRPATLTELHRYQKKLDKMIYDLNHIL